VTDELRPGVLFDVDGTLVDTNYLHTLAWSRAFADAGEWAPMNAIHRLIGMGGDQLVPELLGRDSPRAVAARPGRYRELLEDVRSFPWAARLLRKLHDAGITVVLATSSPAEELTVSREALDADDAIDGQTTADDVEESKPAPEIFLTAMRMFSIDPGRAVAVGDSVWDIQAARAAGLAAVGVETGGFSRHELGEAGALHVYRDVKEIFDQFVTSPLSRLCP
jgi:HAD superfamily hydrolase (TIGR01509 family)